MTNMLEKCKSEYKGLKCDAIGVAPHTHHHEDESGEHHWWSDAMVIAELREWIKEILESNNLSSGY